MPNPIGHSRTETGTVELSPGELTKSGGVALENGVLTVKNEKLANLIHTKFAEASKLAPGSARATDVDVGVSVKVKG